MSGVDGARYRKSCGTCLWSNGLTGHPGHGQDCSAGVSSHAGRRNAGNRNLNIDKDSMRYVKMNNYIVMGGS